MRVMRLNFMVIRMAAWEGTASSVLKIGKMARFVWWNSSGTYALLYLRKDDLLR